MKSPIVSMHDAGVKICPACYRYSYNARRVCPSCDHEFYAKKTGSKKMRSVRAPENFPEKTVPDA